MVRGFIFLVLSLLSAACSGVVETPVDDGPWRVPVVFAADTHDTRGTIIVGNDGLALAGGFEAWTYAHAGDWTSASSATLLVDNTAAGHAHVSGQYSGGKWNWDYGTPVLWTPNMKVTSFALAPIDAPGALVVAGTAPGDPHRVSYRLPAPGVDRCDLMFAAMQTVTTFGAPIPTNFKHALAQLEISAVKDAGIGENVVVTGLRIVNIHEEGKADLTTPVVWTPFGDAEDLNLTPFLSGAAVGTTATNVLSSGTGTLFVLPQTLQGTSLEVIYTKGGTTKTSTITFVNGTVWEPGTSYPIMLGVKPDYVEFTTSQEWTVPTTGYYYIEAYGADGGKGGNTTTDSWSGGAAGQGCYYAGTFQLTAGQVVNVQAGGKGGDGGKGTSGAAHPAVGSGGTGTYFGGGGNGGGSERDNSTLRGGAGGGGGAASGIMVGTNVLLAASGGGGGGGAGNSGSSAGAQGVGGNGGSNGGNGGRSGSAGNPARYGEGGTAGNSADTDGKGSNGATSTLGYHTKGGGGGGGGGWTKGGGGGGINGDTGGNGGGGGGGAGSNYSSGVSLPAGLNQPVNLLQRPANGAGIVRITYLGNI